MNLQVFLLILKVTSVVQGCQQSTEMKKKTDEETVGRGNIGKNAMVVSGGLNADNDNVGVKVELIYPDGNKSCHLPDLPDERMFHTHDGNIVCGGGKNSAKTRSCDVWKILNILFPHHYQGELYRVYDSKRMECNNKLDVYREI